MKPIIKQNPEKPIAAEIIADSIVEIAAGMKKLNSSRLSRRAILLLLRDQSGESLETINRVLNALDSLESEYVKGRK